MRYPILMGLALLIVAPASGQAPAALEAKQEAAPPAAEKLISIDVKNARFDDAMLALAKQGHFNFVSDSYYSEEALPRIQIDAVPVSVAMKKLAELYERKIVSINGVFVLSHRKGLILLGRDEISRTQYESTWLTEGQCSIKPLAKIRVGTASLEIKLEMTLPPFVAIEANATPALNFVRKLSAACDWPVLLDSKQNLGDRRLSAYFEQTTPGQAAEALTVLFHAGQRVVIAQSDAQVKQDAALFAKMTDQRSPRNKSSDLLLPQIMKRLTKAQLDSYNKGEQVEIPVASLPADLQKVAMEYVALSVAGLDDHPEFPRPDPARGYSLMLASYNAGIGIIAYAADGTRLGF